jgi:hypothetical protein
MTTPYTRQLQAETSGGQIICIEMPAPPRGVLSRLIVKQIEGALQGFTFDVFDREQACLDSSYEISEAGAEDGGGVAQGLEEELHKVLATVDVAASTATSEQFGLERPYVNQDDRDQRETPRSMLYFRLDPSGDEAKVFQIAYTITSDVGK